MLTSEVCPDCREPLPQHVLTRRTAQVVWSVPHREGRVPVPEPEPVPDPMVVALEEAVQAVTVEREAWRQALGEEEVAKVAFFPALKLVKAREAYSVVLELLGQSSSPERTIAAALLEKLAGEEEVRVANLELTRASEVEATKKRMSSEEHQLLRVAQRKLRVNMKQVKRLSTNSYAGLWLDPTRDILFIRRAQETPLILGALFLGALHRLARSERLPNGTRSPSSRITVRQLNNVQRLTDELDSLIEENESLSSASDALGKEWMRVKAHTVLATNALRVAEQSLEARAHVTPEEAVAFALERVSAIELLRSPNSPSAEMEVAAYQEATVQTAARAVALQEARWVEEEARDVVFRSEARAGMHGTQGVTTIYG